VSNFTQCSDSSDWISIFVEIENALVWIGDLAQVLRKQVVVGKLVAGFYVFKQAIVIIKVVLGAKIILDDLTEYYAVVRFLIIHYFFNFRWKLV
jgi:hypothetical protein